MYHHTSSGVAARSALHTWRYLSLPLPTSSHRLPLSLPLQVAAIRSYCSHSPLTRCRPSAAASLSVSRAASSSQPLRYYSRKQKRDNQSKQQASKDELSNRDTRSLQRLKTEHRATEQRLIAEAEDEQRENMEAAMEDLDPLTTQQRAELQSELNRLRSGGPLSNSDKQRLTELDSVLQLDTSRQARQQQHMQRFKSRSGSSSPSTTKEPYDYTGFGDTPVELNEANDPQYRKIKAEYQAEVADRQNARKKRPNRKPFNPLPATYQMDDEFDIPSEVQMDRAEWDEVADDDQQLVRTYMGLQRLRRNEQKLARILQMSKPSKLDLLLLLNEVDALEGKDRRFMERYVGPKLGWEELEEDLELAFDWNMLEDNDLPEFVGDSDIVNKARRLRAQQEEDEDESSEELSKVVEVDKRTVNAAGVYVNEVYDSQEAEEKMEAADHRRRAAVDTDVEVLTREEESAQLLYDRWTQMKDRQDAEGTVEPIEPRGALLADERHDSDLAKLTALNPALYEIDHEDDEYQDPEDQDEEDMENDLIMDIYSRARDKAELADKRTDAQLAEEKVEATNKLREMAKDETVQAVFGKDGLELLLKDQLTIEDEQRMRAAVAADEKELDTLQSLSSVWRIKQEMVAEWRALVKETGGQWDERAVHKFMDDDDNSVESVWDEEDDVLEELDNIEQRDFNRAIQAVRKQKRWVADQIKRVGPERVKQAVRDGALQLKTHAAVQAVMAEVLTEKIVKGQDMAAQLEELMDSELDGMDEQLADMFGVRPEDVKKLRDGEQVDESKLFLSAEELAKRNREARPAQYARIEEAMEDSMRAWFERDLLAEAAGAEQEGDAVAAKKLRLMHARRTAYEEEASTRQSSVAGDQLREQGKILSDEVGVRTIEHAMYGLISVEEAEVNRQLVARGDTHSPRFMDAVEDIEQLSPALKAPAGDDGVERKDPNQLAAEWEAMSDEQRAAISDKVELEDREANDKFDSFVLTHIPLKLHHKAVREWHKLSDVDKRRVMEEGRANRHELRHWMWERVSSSTERGESIDPLGQYWIDEPDPKLHGAVEGAFWHVGRWGLDEQTDAERRVNNSKRIVRRHAPLTPDTQTLLDEAERALFPVQQSTEDDEAARHVDIDVNEDEQMANTEDSGNGRVERTDTLTLALDTAADSQEADEEADLSDLSEFFNEQPEAADEFDVLNEEAEDPDDDLVDPRRGASEQREDGEDDEITAGGDGGGDETPTLVERDGYIEYYDDGETLMNEDAESADTDEMDEDEDEDEEQDVERDELNDLDDESFNPRLVRHQNERDERRQKFEDLDPVPTGDQRAFDDQYFHYDEDEYALMTKLDPNGEEDDDYRKPQSQETVWNEYTQQDETGQLALVEETRHALYLLHQSQPSVWTPAALAMKFRMSHQHVKGILMIEAADRRMKDHGLEEEDNPLYTTDREEDVDGAEDYRAMVDQIKFRESLIRRGENGEMIELNDIDDLNEVIPETMLHYLPRLPRPRVPDVRFVNENELAAVLEEERDVEERFLTQQAKLAKRESEHFARQGPIGAATAPKYSRKTDPDDNYQQPTVWKDGKLLPPIPHHLVLVDISERRQDRYSMAVRDVTGWLREPTPIEFVNARRRERSEKARFVYVQYRHENNTPL